MVEAKNATFKIVDGKTIALNTLKYDKGPDEYIKANTTLTLDQFGKIPNVDISNFVANLKVVRQGNEYDFSGNVTGSAKVSANGKEIVKGKLDASYEGGKAKGTVLLEEVAPLDFGMVSVKIHSGTTGTFEQGKGVTEATIGADVKIKESSFTAKVGVKDNDLDSIDVSGEIKIENFIKPLMGDLTFAYKKGDADPISITGTRLFSTTLRMSPAPPRGMTTSTMPRARVRCMTLS